jgi:predicted O-linked N-acetylglucosamine transferase (SPINDLY family)
VNTEPPHYQLNNLLKYYQTGKYVDAKKLALSISKKFPNHQFAWKVLSAIYNRTNKISEALYAIQKCVSLNPHDIDSQKNLSFILQQLGKFNEAEENYRKMLSLKCNHIEVYNYLGVVQNKQGKLIEAEESYRKMIELKPDLAEAYNNLGNILNEQGKLIEAEESFKKAITLKPGYFEVYYNMGIMFNDQRKYKEAELSYKKALTLKPDHIETHNNLGNTFKEQGKFDAAEANYKKALTLKPDHVEVHNNLGCMLNEQGKFVEAEISFRKAITLNSDYTEAYSNLGNTLQGLGKIEEAIENYDKAIKVKIDYSNAYHNKNLCLNYSSSYSPLYVYRQHLKFEKQFGEIKTKPTHRVNIIKKPNERLRIGYVSGDFREHSVAYFFKPLLENHNDHVVETFCYYNNIFVDKMTKNLMKASDHWRSIFGITNFEVSKMIKSDKIDILVDLSGHTDNNNLLAFAQKPAPIQVTWLGYPNTTGLSAIDYRFTDLITDPIGETDKIHSEKLFRLANGFLCFQGNKKVLFQSELPQSHKDYITFGSFNNSSKITPEVIKIWSKILHLVPKSRLILKCSKFKYNKDHFFKLFKSKDLTQDRIHLYEHVPSTNDHLKLYNSIDIGLDPFPYNGTTTTCEALWMGVPVITLLGDRHAGRVGASILTNVGLKDFIARDIDSYIKLAVEISANTKYLKEIRKTLRKKMLKARLCDAHSFAKDIESAYKEIWYKYHK